MSELTPLSREVGVSERTLRRAINQGTLRGSRPSSRKVCLPLAERRYVRRSWATLASVRSALRTERNVRLAVLFGSTARGTDKRDSDLDVLVHLCDSRLERVVDLSLKLTRLTGRSADIVRLADAEREPSLLLDIVTHGRVLVDRDGLWSTLLAGESRLRRKTHRLATARVDAALDGIDRLLSV